MNMRTRLWTMLLMMLAGWVNRTATRFSHVCPKARWYMCALTARKRHTGQPVACVGKLLMIRFLDSRLHFLDLLFGKF